MKFILLIIGLYICFQILSLIFNKVRQFIDKRNYLEKLRKLNINTIDTEDLIDRLARIKKYNSFLTDAYYQKYFNDNSDQMKIIDNYIMQEASHRRSKRNPSKGASLKRYYRYRRY